MTDIEESLVHIQNERTALVELHNKQLDQFRSQLRFAFQQGILDQLRALTDEQRHELFGHFCRHCGSKDPRCQCWNDE